MSDTSGTLDPAIAEVIANRYAEIKAAAELKAQEEAERDSERRSNNHAIWDALEIALKEWQPQLAPYWERQDDDEEIFGTLHRVVFRLPEMAKFCAYFNYSEGDWKQSQPRDGKYTVMRYSLEYKNEYSSRRSIDERWWSSYNNLPDALLEAQNQYQNLLNLQITLERERAEKEAANQERARAKQAVEEHAGVDELQESAERYALLSAIADNPTDVAFLELFAAIKRERAGYLAAIEELTEAAYAVAEEDGRKLTEAQRQAKDNAAEDERKAKLAEIF